MSAAAPAAGRAMALTALIEAGSRSVPVREVLCAPELTRDLDRRDIGFATRLALGATATSGSLDEVLDRCLTHPHRVSRRLRLALRIAAFELIYLERAPRVAVSQGVELARCVARASTGLANAVLRRVAEQRETYLQAADVADPQDRSVVASARACGMPAWLARAIVGSIGWKRAQSLFDAELGCAPIVIQLDPARGPSAELESSDLLAGDQTALPAPLDRPLAIPGCFGPLDGSALMATGALKRGDAVVSDACAQLIATAATAPGSCLEVGAGRGTKTFTMAAQARRAGFDRMHVALDANGRRCDVCRRRLATAGLGEGMRTVVADGRDLNRTLAGIDGESTRPARFDTVLLDAPCSGTGTMRRHPEIPWRLRDADVSEVLPALQRDLLDAAASRVERGGQLLYATCSVLRSENEAIIDAFLAGQQGARFERAPLSAAPIFSVTSFAQTAALARACEDDRGAFATAPVPGGFDGHYCVRLICRA